MVDQPRGDRSARLDAPHDDPVPSAGQTPEGGSGRRQNQTESAATRRRSQRARHISRRRVLKILSGLGVSSAVFRRALAAEVQAAGAVTPEMIQQAEWIAGLELKPEDRESTARGLSRALAGFKRLRGVKLDNGVAPALLFNPMPGQPLPDSNSRGQARLIEAPAPQRPATDDDLAFLPVTALGALVRTRQVTSLELTKLYLNRLRRFDPVLKCVITYTEELALRQAERADQEIAAGHYRGPLHGIPWGAKDLIAWPGYKTTWGATPFKDQVIDTKATVAARLEEAGAVLVAKLSLGALAEGDRWFGNMTRNPWNVREGSSGSSAGSACATAAGLVGFALGSETMGSIVSPCGRCGATGLRPTFGRVSRYGCMTLTWSLDKIGPIARTVEDCAIVLAAIHGFDGLDATAVDRPFDWPSRRDLRSLRVGYVENSTPVAERKELSVLTDLGVKLVPIKMPSKYPVSALTVILDTEAAAVFDELTRQDITQDLNSWPETFRQGQFVPAIEYLRANRIRTLVMREMDEIMSEVDLYVGGRDLTVTNLTGHPTVIVPNGMRARDGVETPSSLTFTGRLFGEAELLAVAHAYQRATDFHLARPPMEKALAAETEDSKTP
jgi:Asp-tRNA(Asn)/Glu-tRNA(Gln) amidotransferase A subunit family amidase